MRKLKSLLIVVSVAATLGGCLVHETVVGRRGCGPGEYWDGGACRHHGHGHDEDHDRGRGHDDDHDHDHGHDHDHR
jgi:hypothetical protein